MESDIQEQSQAQEQVPALKPIELRTPQEASETVNRGSIFDRALQKLGFGKEREQSSFSTENTIQNPLMQSPDSEAHQLEDTAKLEETRRDLQQEIKAKEEKMSPFVRNALDKKLPGKIYK